MRSCTVHLRIWTSPPATPPRCLRSQSMSGKPSSLRVTSHGLSRATSRYARLVLRFPGSGDELEMDLLKEALEPRWVTVQITPAASVRALSLDDTVGLKARSWHDRFLIRHLI